MALICDVCKTRPATARVAFMHEGHQHVVDVCQEDFVKLQSGSPRAIKHLLENGESDSYTKELLERSKVIAAGFGQKEVASEHLLVAFVEDQKDSPFWQELHVNPEDVRGYIQVNATQDIRHTDQVSVAGEVRHILGDVHRVADETEAAPGPTHMLYALLQDRGMAGDVLRKFGVTEDAVEELLRESEANPEEDNSRKGTPTLDKYSRDLTRLAKQGKLDPVIGRAQEIETTIEVLSRRTKNNPVLIGEPGVGKTAIVEGLAQKIQEGSVPASLRGKRLLELSLSSMVAGSRYRGEFEERVENVLKEIHAHKESVLVFIDELHSVVGAGGSEGGLDASNILKPALARGELHLIGATTLNEYQKHIEKDAALERRFQPIIVNEPSVEDSIAIITGLLPKYEIHHAVKITGDAVKSAVELSDRYMTQRFLPDKAIDLLDQAASRVRIQGGEKADLTVTDANIAEVLAKLTGIPVTELTQEEKTRLLALEERLRERVVGQEAAITAVANAIRVSRAGFAERHSPIATFLFLGPTGVGKTELAKALAADLFGSENALTRIDMSEYMERHAVSRLIGSPPGYVGFEEGGQLTEAVRRHPYSVILLDEIEKAHPEVANILLQLLDDGRLTDGKGRVVDFSNAVIIATSNLGNDLQRHAKIGFQSNGSAEELQSDVVEQLQHHFRPEFINRIDEIICFNPLTEKQIEQIVELQLERVKKNAAEKDIKISWTKGLTAHLAEVGFDIRFGARELKRQIKKEVENRLAEGILRGTLRKKKVVTIDYQNNLVTIK